MHTLLVILGCLVLMAVVFGIALWRGTSLRRAFPPFAVLWAVTVTINLWVGVAHAGYSLADELPILAMVFGIPCVVAWLLARQSA